MMQEWFDAILKSLEAMIDLPGARNTAHPQHSRSQGPSAPSNETQPHCKSSLSSDGCNSQGAEDSDGRERESKAAARGPSEGTGLWHQMIMEV